MPDEFQNQIQALITELNIGHLTPEEQDTVLEGLGNIVMQRVLLKVFEILPPTEHDAFAQMVAANEQDAIQKAFAQYVPNIADIIREETVAAVEEHKRLIAEEVGKGA